MGNKTLKILVRNVFSELEIPISDDLINKIVEKYKGIIKEIEVFNPFSFIIYDTCNEYDDIFFFDFSPILYMKQYNLPIDEFMVFYVYFKHHPKTKYDIKDSYTKVFTIDLINNDVYELMTGSEYAQYDVGAEIVYDRIIDGRIFDHLSSCIESHLEDHTDLKFNMGLINNIIFNVLLNDKITKDKYVYSIICGMKGIHIKFDYNYYSRISTYISDPITTNTGIYFILLTCGTSPQLEDYLLLYIVDYNNNRVVPIGFLL